MRTLEKARSLGIAWATIATLTILFVFSLAVKWMQATFSSSTKVAVSTDRTRQCVDETDDIVFAGCEGFF